MSKGVAVPYIIALILGIVVIGLLGYWFFVLGGQTGGTATAQTCNAKEASWCQQWSVTGFSGNCPATQFCDINNPAATPTVKWQAFAPGCSGPPLAADCQALFGQSGTSSSSTTGSSSSTTGSATCSPACPSGQTCVNGQCVK